MVRRAALQVDGLPDARQGPIPALPTERDFGEGRIGELGRVVGRAIGAELDLVAAGLELRGNVEAEGQEAALVRADQLAVHEHPAVVEHGPEPQPDAVAQPLRRAVEFASVDADAGPHPKIRKLRLPGSRHGDRTDLRRPAEPVVRDVQEFPRPIEAQSGSTHAASLFSPAAATAEAGSS